jgi:hypothetical protein
MGDFIRAMLPAILATMDAAIAAIKSDPQVAAAVCKQFDANGCVSVYSFVCLGVHEDLRVYYTHILCRLFVSCSAKSTLA